MTNRARKVPFPLGCLVATFALALLGAGPAVANIRHGISVGTTILGTNGGQWKASPDLTPGPHQLSVTACHTSSQFSTNAAAWFTNSAATDRAINGFDAAGQLTHKVWLSSNGTTNRTQNLYWDAKGQRATLEGS